MCDPQEFICVKCGEVFLEYGKEKCPNCRSINIENFDQWLGIDVREFEDCEDYRKDEDGGFWKG